MKDQEKKEGATEMDRVTLILIGILIVAILIFSGTFYGLWELLKFSFEIKVIIFVALLLVIIGFIKFRKVMKALDEYLK